MSCADGNGMQNRSEGAGQYAQSVRACILSVCVHARRHICAVYCHRRTLCLRATSCMRAGHVPYMWIVHHCVYVLLVQTAHEDPWRTIVSFRVGGLLVPPSSHAAAMHTAAAAEDAAVPAALQSAVSAAASAASPPAAAASATPPPAAAAAVELQPHVLLVLEGSSFMMHQIRKMVRAILAGA